MNKIQKSIFGLNLIYDKGSKDELLSLAKGLFDESELKSISLFDNCYSSLTWNNNLKKQFDDNTISFENRLDYVTSINDHIIRMHQLNYLLRALLTNNEVIEALKTLEKYSELEVRIFDNPKVIGYRLLLEYYAEISDYEKFIELIKQCEISKEKNQIQRIKNIFIANFALKFGIEKVIKVLNTKVFGEKYIYCALIALTKQVDYMTMKNLLANNTFFNTFDSNNKTQILVETFENAAKNQNFSDLNFEELYEKVLSIDPKIKAGVVRLKDILFVKLGQYSTKLDYVIRCKKEITSNEMKKELSIVEQQLKK
ncbi:hypothetical protein [Flavobacterium sp. CF136]|uniref:hypothetical protein n=1 Tax=Flavobacterium sp. (strain CF136) TaxID=1144313 RepID=UPI000271D260|nr:hypothetical protein [Flavobacterium sp. CF136]EJL62136.1 hypothetical protein PMI10_03034 [Flavobacterium sp. CF136]